ncbi:GyrI-like domain-containing protein [Actinospica robiniae]|uniref:GyrI-like domain-containing protein n=1 Tax=Actinospica robiniae TaxID=304901 RepID=UPI0005556777|nr:GyrI-like domain-containing protein [Actinospica robiniae]
MTSSPQIDPAVEPVIEDWLEQPYLGLAGVVTLETIGMVEGRIPELLTYLAGEGIEPAGPVFVRYRVIDMFRRLEIEAGVPLAAPIRADGELHCDVLPAGRYVTYTHTGPSDEHIPVIGAIFEWADAQGLSWDVTPVAEGEQWGGRLAITLAGSPGDPDRGPLTTKFAFRLAD